MNETGNNISHYYGDIVRILFLVSAIIMILGLPVITGLINIPIIISVIAILILGLAAGLTNPKQKWDAIINVIISTIGFIVFEYYAVTSFSQAGQEKLFIPNLVLGLIFLFALYFSVKTLRGLMVK